MNSYSKFQTISDRIRALAAEGRSRSEIARLVDRSYQQVRQVLVADEAKRRRNRTEPNASAASPSTDTRTMEAIDVSDLGDNKSAKMRRYAQHGFSRSEIARHMGVRYQFVHNVLTAPGLGAESAYRSDARQGVEEPTAGFQDDSGLPMRLTVDAQGRIQLPPGWSRPGAVFIARKFLNDVVLIDVSAASEAARLVSMRSATDALIAERRWEAMREFDD